VRLHSEQASPQHWDWGAAAGRAIGGSAWEAAVVISSTNFATRCQRSSKTTTIPQPAASWAMEAVLRTLPAKPDLRRSDS